MQRVPASSHSYNISFSFSVLSIWLGVQLLFCEISCAHSASQTDTNVNNLHTFTGKRIVLFEDGAKHKTQLRLVCSHTIFNAITDLSPLLIKRIMFFWIDESFSEWNNIWKFNKDYIFIFNCECTNALWLNALVTCTLLSLAWIPNF